MMDKFLTKNSSRNFAEWIETVREDGAFALIDKDKDWTSFDVVAKLRNLVRIKKTGHAGTLDPLATGLLILAFGKATKRLQNYVATEKEYYAKVKLGAVTKTDDSEADEENILDISDIIEDDIISAVNSFIGKIQQIPPMYSAKKVKGQRLYKLARKNMEVEIAPSDVEIFSIENIKINKPYVEFLVKCSKGTYIRALARDIGAKLGCGGYLFDLRRTAIGEYKVGDALKIEEFSELVEKYAIKKEV